MLAAGLARQKEGSGRCYDQFRGRLTFAIANEHGRICGFSARSLEAKPADGGKYINTPETPVFRKGNLLYGLAAARKAIAESGHAILCEGQMDTIAFHRAGVDCAVAPLGTAFTPEQAKILRRYTSHLLLAFDSDGAGQKAVERAAEILLPLSMDVKVIAIPGGKDPDELFSTGGAEAVRKLVDTARPLISVLASRLPGRFDLKTPVGRGEAAAWIAGFLKRVENRVELEGYAAEAAEALSVSVEAIYAELAGQRRLDRRREGFTPETRKEPVRAAESEEKEVYPAALLSLLELAVNSSDAARRIAELVEPEELTSKDPVTEALNTVLSAAVNGEMEEGIGEVRDSLTRRPVPEISRILVEHTPCPDTERAVSESVAEFRRIRSRDKKKELMTKLRNASSAEEKMALLKAISQLA